MQRQKTWHLPAADRPWVPPPAARGNAPPVDDTNFVSPSRASSVTRSRPPPCHFVLQQQRPKHSPISHGRPKQSQDKGCSRGATCSSTRARNLVSSCCCCSPISPSPSRIDDDDAKSTREDLPSLRIEFSTVTNSTMRRNCAWPTTLHTSFSLALFTEALRYFVRSLKICLGPRPTPRVRQPWYETHAAVSPPPASPGGVGVRPRA
jgi:hypothetical protein